jgi:hypothetical protein
LTKTIKISDFTAVGDSGGGPDFGLKFKKII